MHLRFFGGFAIEHEGEQIDVRGRGQEALLFRLALDTGTTVTYRALAEDVWPDEPPEDPRAALQSLVSRLRRALPAGALTAVSGGYRLSLDRADVDLTQFQDLVATARRTGDPQLARRALQLWRGDPWTPAGFDWVVRDLLEDRAHAERLVREAEPASPTDAAAHPAVRTPMPVDPAPVDPAPVDAPVDPAPSPPAVAEHAPIPAPLAALVGRTDELALIRAQLAENRLVTLLGAGGAGKTTLALETARATPGAVVIELAPASAGEVWDVIAAAFGRSIRLTETPAAALSPRDRVLQALPGRAVLLVVDNAEHVIAEAADAVHEILRAAPGVRVLATSREPLGVAGEAFVELGPLPEADAVDLLSRRIRAARGAAPDASELPAVARIARRLDGLPLALELAAAKSRTLTIAELEEGLSDRFALLGSGPRTSEARHQTLRALIDWSWELLGDAERRALLMLAVFPDGISAADVGAVAASFQTDASHLDALVDRSLVRRIDGRYRMLETVREYGLDTLRRTGADDEARGRQARVIARLAAAIEPLVRTAQVRRGISWFDANDENLSAAMRWCADRPELADTGVLLVRSQFWTWLMRERFDALTLGIERFGATATARFVPGAAGEGDPDPHADPDPETDPDTEAAAVLAAITTVFEVMNTDPHTVDAVALAARTDAITQAAASLGSELGALVPALLRATLRAVRAGAGGRPWPAGFELAVDDVPRDAPAWSHACAAVIRAAIAQNNGDVDLFGTESARALAAFEPLGDAWGIALSSQLRSEWLTLNGHLEEALRIADGAAADLRGLTSVSDQLQQRAQAVSLLTRLGRLDEARARIAEVDALAATERSDRVLQMAAWITATFEVAVGDPAAALAVLDGAAGAAQIGLPEQFLAWKDATRARALVLAGDLDAAREPLRRAMATALRTDDGPIIADVALAVACWFEGAGRMAEARAALAESDRLRGRRDDTEPTVARLVRALDAAAQAQTTEGTDAAASVPSDLAALVALI